MREQGDIRIDIVGVRAKDINRLEKLVKQSSFGSESLDVVQIGDRIFGSAYDVLYPGLPDGNRNDGSDCEQKREGYEYTMKWLSLVLRCINDSGFFSYTCVFSEKREVVMQRVLLHGNEDPREFRYEEFGVDVVGGRPIGKLVV